MQCMAFNSWILSGTKKYWRSYLGQHLPVNDTTWTGTWTMTYRVCLVWEETWRLMLKRFQHYVDVTTRGNDDKVHTFCLQSHYLFCALGMTPPALHCSEVPWPWEKQSSPTPAALTHAELAFIPTVHPQCHMSFSCEKTFASATWILPTVLEPLH